MTVTGIIAVAVLSILLTSIFVFGLRTKGPWGNGWSFLIVVVLSLWMVSLWVPPAGPIWYGAAWIDLLITGLLVSFILSAVTPSPHQHKRSAVRRSEFIPGSEVEQAEKAEFHRAIKKDKAIIAAGSFFWMLLLFLCVMIIIGAV